MPRPGGTGAAGLSSEIAGVDHAAEIECARLVHELDTAQPEARGVGVHVLGMEAQLELALLRGLDREQREARAAGREGNEVRRLGAHRESHHVTVELLHLLEFVGERDHVLKAVHGTAPRQSESVAACAARGPQACQVTRC